MKKHFDLGCWRARDGRKTDNVWEVTCEACKGTGTFVAAMKVATMKKQAAFEAQEPRTFIEPWRASEGNIVCRGCGNDTFREGDRTCYGHYANFHCASCGHVESRLTETGMSF